MKIDLFLIGDAVRNRPYDVPEILSGYAQSAERGGFDAVWIAEHHFIRYGGCPSTPLLAAHLLATTTRLRVGTAACVLSTRHPVALAEEAVMLDKLSGGRFMLGVARGGRWIDLEVFGTGAARFDAGFVESLDLLRGWLSGPPQLRADGKFFQFRPVPVLARPAAEFPVWIAATSPATVDVAAQRGLPLLLGVHATDEDKAAMIRRYADTAHRFGHDPATVEHAAVYLAQAGDNARSERDRWSQSMTHWLAQGIGDYQRLDGSRGSTDQAGYVQRLLTEHLVGPVEDSAVRLRESVERTGITRALLLVEAAGTPAAVRENIERLGAGLVSTAN
jgi:alkanesulfonate monooxygenase SsuD/methylene tetrahydromethanopterin reductase-like flavin-dependent oxidoreductase (luciferase family)